VCDDTALIDCISSSQNIENEFISKEEALSLSKAIELLPRDDKDLIKWFYFDRRSLKSYAKYENLTYAAAKKRKQICLLKLKKILTKTY
jgi:DNA-directed RNA polymerase specialized sigma24 family protein